MYITQLEIDNFKSFGRKTKIPFFEGFTVISGPNGSGKSNIIDSILFCLALSSARGLRAEKLTDLINLNTGKNTAEVAITFSDETKIRRRIKRTSHGYYSYNYLNDRPCKQGDIVDYLGKLGIKAEGYNVVMQGDITRITEMSDLERRRIIDEIAGVAEFDKKKSQALGELEVVRERIEREELLLRELSVRLEELKSERESALKHRHLQERLEYFNGCLSAAHLRNKQRELDALEHLSLDQNAEMEIISENISKENESASDLGLKIQDVDREINQKSGTEYLQLLSTLEEVKGAIKVSEQTIVRLKKDKEAGLEVIRRIYIDRTRASERVSEFSEMIRNLSIDRSNLGMELAGTRAELEDVDRKIRSEEGEVSGAKEELFALMKEQEIKKTARSEIQREQDLLIEKSRMRTSEKERISVRLEQVDLELSEKSSQCKEYEGLIEKISAEKKVLDQRLSKDEGTLFSNRSALEKLKERIHSKERELMRLEAQQQASGGPGNHALEAIMEMDGIYGTVAQLGRAPPEYATALDTAAGGRLRNVVVENDSVASGAIRFLKENRLGRVTFLPLNRLRSPDIPLLSDKNVIGYAVNLLEYDSVYDKVFRQVFGRTVVIGRLDEARKLMGRYRMVTLEGELLEMGGAMTGGSQKKRMGGFGVAVDDDINSIMHEIAALNADAADLEQAVVRHTKAGEEERRERSALDEQIARYRMLADEYGKRISSVSEEGDGIRASLKSMQDDVHTGAERLAALETDITEISREISSLEASTDELKRRLDDTGIPALSEDMERLGKSVTEQESRLRNKDADIADAQRERQYFSKRIEEFDVQRSDTELKNKAIDDEIAGEKVSVLDNGSKIAELEARQQSFSKELEDLRKSRDALNLDLHAIEKSIMELNSADECIRLQIASLGERKQVLCEEIATLSQEAGETETDLSLQEIEDGVSGTEKSLKRLGAVNMLAIEEYEKVEVRVGERTQKKEVLSSERTKLIERIEYFGKMKYDSFMGAYTVIDTNFRKIFARLTEGSGHLVLDNEDDPFSGGMTFAVAPRDKKVHLLSSLSGGEKSLTTLSFIFAIQQYMPAPFYALDEVDMMLDGSNVERISTMMKELSAGAQSICVSLRNPTIQRADRILGVTARPDKSTYVTGVKNNA